MSSSDPIERYKQFGPFYEAREIVRTVEVVAEEGFYRIEVLREVHREDLKYSAIASWTKTHGKPWTGFNISLGSRAHSRGCPERRARPARNEAQADLGSTASRLSKELLALGEGQEVLRVKSMHTNCIVGGTTRDIVIEIHPCAHRVVQHLL